MENMKPTGCGMMDGSLPGKCASMVFPYIPMEGMDPARYDQREALAIGTLFPGLNLPFFRAVKSRMNCDNNALCELMALGFAVTELGEYLDTHQDDQEAFQLFQKYAALAEEGKRRYEAMYGPLTQMAAAKDAAYQWLNDPWPWEYDQKGAGK